MLRTHIDLVKHPVQTFVKNAPRPRDVRGAHAFSVGYAADKDSLIALVEDFGDMEVPERMAPRARIDTSSWAAISEIVRDDFCVRLKAKKLPGYKWSRGETVIDRMLGKELCVLFWAVEQARDAAQALVMATHRQALRPEERWWLYAQAAAQNNDPGTKSATGWRKALFHAFGGVMA